MSAHSASPHLPGRAGASGPPRRQKLKPGPGMSKPEVAEHQRRRLLAATIALTAECGYEGLTVRSLAAAAGVSSRTFYKHFANVEDCFASTFDAVMSGAARRTDRTRGGGGWEGELRTAVRSLMEAIAARPREAHLALVDVFSAGPAALNEHGPAGSFELLLADAFARAPAPVAAPRHLVIGIAAGTTRVARRTVMAGRGDELPELADELVDWMLSLPRPQLVALRGGVPIAGAAPGRSELAACFDGGAGTEQGARRRLLLGAAIRLAAAEGPATLTPRVVCSAADLPRRTFDENFDSVEECFLEAVELVAVTAVALAVKQVGTGGPWQIRLARTILSLCTQIAASSRLGALALVGITGPGSKGLLRREDLLSWAAERLRHTVPSAERPSELVAEASVAAAWQIARVEVAGGRAGRIGGLSPLLAYVILAPTMGAAAATRAIISQPAHPGAG
jgi:AcrR family transcriptional regulator